MATIFHHGAEVLAAAWKPRKRSTYYEVTEDGSRPIDPATIRNAMVCYGQSTAAKWYPVLIEVKVDKAGH